MTEPIENVQHEGRPVEPLNAMNHEAAPGADGTVASPRFFMPRPTIQNPAPEKRSAEYRGSFASSRNNVSYRSQTFSKAKPVIPRAPRRALLTDTSLSQEPTCENCREVSRCSGHAQTGTLAGGVELQIEVLSPFVWRSIMVVWYGVLIVAMILQPLSFITWRLVDICGEDAPDLWDYEKWNSSCVTLEVEDVVNDTYRVQWSGGPYPVDFSDHLLRFRNLVISLPSPNDWVDGGSVQRSFTVNAVIPFVVEDSNWSSIPIQVVCHRGPSRCSHADLAPNAVLNSTDKGHMSLTLSGVPGSIAQNIGNSAVGILFQRHTYALGVLIWRYAFLVISLLHILRFIVNKKYTNSLYEQAWVMVLQFTFIWYLNPFAALAVSPDRLPIPLEFLEFHISWWFMAVLVGFMFSVITASMPRADRKTSTDQRGVSAIRAYLCRSRNIYDPPLWTKIVTVLFILTAIALDMNIAWYRSGVTLYRQEFGWTVSICILGGQLVCGGFICCCLLFCLRRNMGKKSYLDSRPQQLACRVFILMFIGAIAFNVYQLVCFCYYHLNIPGMLAWQPLIQLPALMVWSILVNIMTLIYTTRRRSKMVPVHPRDTRWKLMVWPDSWYRWLARHGGSMYIFHTEKEEASFNWNQLDFRIRQHCSRVKKNNPSGLFPATLTTPPNSSRHVADMPGSRLAHSASALSISPRNRPPRSWRGLRELILAGGESRVLNMDMTSTCFLPGGVEEVEEEAQPKTSSNTFQVIRAGGGREVRSMATLEACNSEDGTKSDSQAALRLEESDESRRGSVQQGLNPGDSELPPADVERGTETRGNDATGSDDISGFRSSRLKAAFHRLQSAISAFVKGAERNLITRPVHAFEQAETYLLDIVQQTLHDPLYLPFFNLETAIDCFNVSLEAYNIKQTPCVWAQQEKVSASWLCCCSGDPSSVSDPLAAPIEQNPGTGEGSQERSGGSRPVAAAESPGTMTTPSRKGLHVIDVEQYGYRLHAVWEVMNVQVIITEMNTTEERHRNKAPRLVIAFRGTINASNTFQNMRVIRAVWDEMLQEDRGALSKLGCCWGPTVHTGFLSIWDAHSSRIHEKLKELLMANSSTVYRVFCTGHSMGGAVACLCAYSVRRMLRHMKYPLDDVTVYTFGQPPMGNAAFKSAYDKAVPRTFRVVNENDPVGTISMYGTHVGIEVDIDRHGNYICKPTFIEQLFRPMKRKIFEVGSHLMWSYATSLNAIARDSACKARATSGPRALVVCASSLEPAVV